MIVIDASVAMKWVLADEEYKEKATALLKAHSDGKEKIIIPDLFFYEIANALATKTRLTSFEASRSLRVIIKANLEIYRPIPKEMLEAVKLAKKFGTSVYDMLYAVVAKRNKAKLVTADERFKEKTKFSFVKSLKEIKVFN